MNDFTKEELVWLEEDMRLAIEEYSYHQPAIAYTIHKKLKAMIDSYCDHTCQHEIDDYQPAYQCSKCKRYFAMEKFEEADEE